MVILDSSAIIPLITIGKLELLRKNFDKVVVPFVVWKEVVEEGKKLGKNTLSFEQGKDVWFEVVEQREEKTKEIKSLHRLQENDALVFLLAKEHNDILLTNDAGLYSCCQAEGINVWWLTTLLLASVKKKIITRTEAEAALLALVNSAHIRLRGDILAQLLLIIKNLG
ncbi:PIN domain-containing protein [Candidatus Woesearchaeota archaeon]|nr:PIN domain-containing protein [Candidatus Woesearchaeota archaeon]